MNNARVARFLAIAGEAVRGFKIPGQRNFFDHMGCSASAFFAHAAKASDAEIEHAIACIKTHEWDQSEFIMAIEGVSGEHA